MAVASGISKHQANILLINAIKTSDVDIKTRVEFLLKAGADLNFQDKDGKTALIHAVCGKTCSTEVLQILLDAGADLNIQDKHGMTALYHIVHYSSNPDIILMRVKMFLKAGADVNIKTLYGYTVLNSIISNTSIHERSRPVLLGTDAGVNIVPSIDWLLESRSNIYNPIIREEIIQILLDAGADVNIQNISGYTALMSAAKTYFSHSISKRVVQMLLDAGANINFQDQLGRTALFFAVQYIDEPNDTLQLLIDAGADVNIQDIYGKTVLILCAKYFGNIGTQLIIEMLISANADVNIKDKHHMTALTYILQTDILDYETYFGRCKKNVMRMLIEAGAKIDVNNVCGTNGLDIIIDYI